MSVLDLRLCHCAMPTQSPKNTQAKIVGIELYIGLQNMTIKDSSNTLKMCKLLAAYKTILIEIDTISEKKHTFL